MQLNRLNAMKEKKGLTVVSSGQTHRETDGQTDRPRYICSKRPDLCTSCMRCGLIITHSTPSGHLRRRRPSKHTPGLQYYKVEWINLTKTVCCDQMKTEEDGEWCRWSSQTADRERWKTREVSQINHIISYHIISGICSARKLLRESRP